MLGVKYKYKEIKSFLGYVTVSKMSATIETTV